MKTFSIRIVKTLLVTASAVALLSCGDNEGREGQLLQVKRSESAELERLTKLQVIRYLKTGMITEWGEYPNGYELVESYEFNDDTLFSMEGSVNYGCSSGTYQGKIALARAKILKQIADTETVFRYDNGNSENPIVYEIPPQSFPARVGLYLAARRYLRNAITQLLDTYGVKFSGKGTPYVTSTNPLWYTVLGRRCETDGAPELPLWKLATNMLGEALDLYEEVSLSAAELSVKSGDSLALEASSPSEGAVWRYSAALFSRASAAHILLGENNHAPGWGGSTNEAPFCATSRLKPGPALALQYLRQAGQNPETILDNQVSTKALLDNCYTDDGLPSDCTRLRLANILHKPTYDGIDASLPDLVGLTESDFEEARAYLKAEIPALRRSLSKTLSLKFNGQTYLQYAGVATPPEPVPPMVWSALGRGPGSTSLSLSDISFEALRVEGENGVTDVFTDPSLAEIYVKVLGKLDDAKKGIEDYAESMSTDLHDDALRTVDELTSRLSRQVLGGVFISRNTSSLAGHVEIQIDHSGDASNWFLVKGEDGLRCALKGNVEGATCQLDEYADSIERVEDFVATNQQKTHQSVTHWTAHYEPIDYGKRHTIYLIQKTSSGNEALFGAQIELNQTGQIVAEYNNLSTGIVPQLTDRVARFVAIDNNWCGQTEVDCHGFRNDERMPLENSLASDVDPMESSWKYYLDTAKNAAEEARVRGEDYFNAGLEFEKRKESNWTTAHSAELRAAEAIDKIQDICGTAIDPRKILGYLTAGEQNPNNYCGSSKECVSALVNIAKQHVDDADMTRLVQCLDPGTIRPFVSPGSVPLCVWVDNTNPNKVCNNATSANPCPAPVDTANVNGLCSGRAVPVGESAHFEVVQGDDLLGYFTNQVPAASGTKEQARKVCETVRSLRMGTTGGGALPWAKTIDRNALWRFIVESNFFDPTNLSAAPGKLELKLRPRNNAELIYNGKTLWSTNDVEVTTTGNNGVWPCGTGNMPPDCTDTRQGLFCNRSFKCNTMGDRNEILERLRGAVELAVSGKILPGNTASVDSPFDLSELKSFTDDRAYYWNCASIALDMRGTRTSGLQMMVDEPGLKWSHCAFPDVTGKPGQEYYDRMWNAVSASSTDWIGGSGTLWLWSSSERSAGMPLTIEATGNQDILNLKGLGFHSGRVPRRNRWHSQGLDVSRWYTTLAATRADPSNAFLTDYGLSEKLLKIIEPVEENEPCRWDEPGTQCKLSTLAVLDAMELSCQVVAAGNATCSADSPPVLVAGSGLRGATDYLKCLADQLQATAGDMVLARVPSQARDALRKDGALGVFPALGGKLGEAVASLRSSLVDLAEIPGAIGYEVRQMANDIETMEAARKILGIDEKILSVESELATLNTFMETTSAAASFNFVGAAGALAKLQFVNQIQTLKQEAITAQEDLKLQELEGNMNERARTLETYSTRILGDLETLDEKLAEVERLRIEAGVHLAAAMRELNYKAPNSEAIDNAESWQFEETRRRYDEANESAIRAAVLARRAIEQRLGIALNEMNANLPLVSAPSSWVNQICDVKGIDFEGILDKENEVSPSVVDKPVYIGHFVGEYVGKLEKTIESYRQAFPFSDGTDEAVISVRDDLQKVSSTCSVASPNLLPNSSGLATGNAWGALGTGWRVEECPPIPDDDDLLDDYDNERYACLMARSSSVEQTVDGQKLTRFELDYSFDSCEGLGCSRVDVNGVSEHPGATWDASIGTTVLLEKGQYYVSYYQERYECRLGVSIRDAASVSVPVETITKPTVEDRYVKRIVSRFTINETGQYDITFGLIEPNCWEENTMSQIVGISGPMLQKVPYGSYTEFEGIAPYSESDTSGRWSVPICKDVDGSTFQQQGWTRKCMRLCRSGYGTSCEGALGTEECFHELRFRLDDLLMENGLALQKSGFAKGNYNYRVDQVATNFVGTGIRKCSPNDGIAACAGNGTVQYTLEQLPPFYVRNYLGQEVESHIYNGRIEHARGLAAERYVTNPLSSVDRALIEPFARSEFEGRPIGGEYVLRVWDSPDVAFENIEDVQLYLKYRYWTRLK
jgi:hypothetical protein